MNTLTDAEVAWLAGIYEGEGSVSNVANTRAFVVAVSMTDHDIIDRIHDLTGIGTTAMRPIPKDPAKAHWKPQKIWRVGSQDGIDFLEAVLPWLGFRRAQRATEIISRWKTERKLARRGESHCIKGHAYDPPNSRTSDGSCRACRTESMRRWREKQRS